MDNDSGISAEDNARFEKLTVSVSNALQKFFTREDVAELEVRFVLFMAIEGKDNGEPYDAMWVKANTVSNVPLPTLLAMLRSQLYLLERGERETPKTTH